MRSNLLTLVALCSATMSTLPLWAATEWEDPTVQTTTIDLETGGTYFIYHPSTQMFMINGNDANTQLSLGKTGLKINIKKADDPRFNVSGWTLEMPDAPSNNGGKPNYIFVLGDGSRAYVDYNMGATDHFIWKITKNPDGNTYRIKIPDEDPVFGTDTQEGQYANAYMGWDGILNENGEMNTTAVMPLVDPATSGYENAQLDWAFVTVDEYDKFMAKKELKNTLEYAVEKGYTDYSKYEEIYNQTSVTAEEITNASAELSAAIEEYLLANASETNPVDLTSRISQPSFETNTDGWITERTTSSSTGLDNFSRQTSEQKTTDGVTFQNFFERWVATPPQPDWSITQQITGLPQGKYKLSAHILTNSDTPEGLYLIADGGFGEERTAVTEPGNIDGITTARPYDVEFTVLNNTATIGFRAINTNCQWSGVDNFKLTYYGAAESSVKEGLQTTIDEASTYLQQLIADQVKCSNTNKERLTSTLTLAKEAMANESIDDDSVLVIRQTLIANMDKMKNDVEVYSKVMDVIDSKLDQLINSYEPYLELSNNPESFINTFNYTDQTEEAYNNGTFDPADFEKVSTTIDSLFRKDIVNMVNSGLTNDLYGMLLSPDFTDGSNGWNGSPATGNHIAEAFNKQYDIYQELEGLPEGAYKITAKGYYRPGDNTVIDSYWGDGSTNNVYAYLYGNDNTTPLHHICDYTSETPYIEREDGTTNDYSFAALEGKYIPNDMASAEVAFSQGNYPNEVTCVVTDGKLRFGVKMQSDQALANNWTAFDEFRVIYLGNEAVYYLPTIQTLLAEANTLYTPITSFEVYATKDVVTNLETAMTKGNQITEASTLEDAKVSISELTEAISLAQTSINTVTTLSTLIDDIYGERGLNLENAGYDLSEVYNLADEIAIQLEVNEIETTDKANEYISELNTLLTQKIQSTQIAGASKDNPTEIMDLIVNPGFSIFDEESGVESDSGEGWIQERDGGDVNFRISAGEFYNNNSFDIHQVLYGLTPGFYKVTCNAFYREGWPADAAGKHRRGVESLNALLYAGPEDAWAYTPIMSIIEDGQPEATASQNINVADSLTTEENPIDYWFIPNAMEDAGPAFNKGLYYNELYFEVKEGQEATYIGIRKNQHVDGDWTIFDNFHLYYYGNGEENRPDGVENISNGTASIIRSTYYTIDGAQISKPSHRGFYIRKDEMNDGTIKTYKFMLK